MSHYSTGGILRPGTTTLTVVAHSSLTCSDPNHVHSNECIIVPDGRCIRRDEIHEGRHGH